MGEGRSLEEEEELAALAAAAAAVAAAAAEALHPNSPPSPLFCAYLVRILRATLGRVVGGRKEGKHSKGPTTVHMRAAVCSTPSLQASRGRDAPPPLYSLPGEVAAASHAPTHLSKPSSAPNKVGNSVGVAADRAMDSRKAGK